MSTVTVTEPIDIVRAIYDAFARRDLEQILGLMDPSITIEQDPALPWGGRFEGHDGFGRFSMALLGQIDSAVTIESMFQAGEHVVQHGRTARHRARQRHAVRHRRVPRVAHRRRTSGGGPVLHRLGRHAAGARPAVTPARPPVRQPAADRR